MKKWLKENWFKLSILTILLVIAIFALNYFSHYMEEKKEFERRVACAEQVKDLRQTVPEVRRDYELLDSNYNKEDKDCYAYVLDHQGNMFIHIIYDAFRGAEVFRTTMWANDGQVEFYGEGINSTADIDKAAEQVMYSQAR